MENKWLRVLALLILVNIGIYLYNNWGLVTVKVKDAPLRDVINNIEWQAWVKIYTNIPLDTKVTMYADHVPFSEAMETLAVNVDVPPANADDGAPHGPRKDGQPDAGSTNTAAATQPPRGGPGNGGGGFASLGGRAGGFGRAAWNLAFFVGKSKQQIAQEIREFQSGDPNEENKVYSSSTQIQMIATENMTSPDPGLQGWPGYKPVEKKDPPASSASISTADVAAPQADVAPTVHTYFNALTQAANIWIMAPGSWAPEVNVPPPANSLIASAVKNFVSANGGVVTQAYILRSGRGGAPGVRSNVAFSDDNWSERMKNVIQGLPADQREEATSALNSEIDYRKSMDALPPDERRKKMFEHGLEKMLYGERLTRMSPVKRAAMYKRMVAARAAARPQ